MDEVLEVVDLAADLGLEDAFVWLLRVVGLLLVLAGLGLWLFAEVSWLVPAALVVAGVVLLAAPGVLLVLVELV